MVIKKDYCFQSREYSRPSFFRGTKFIIFTKVVTTIYPLMHIAYVLEEHLHPSIMYEEYVWRIFLFQTYCYLRGTLTAIILNRNVIISRDHGSDLRFSTVLCFLFKEEVAVIYYFKCVELRLPHQLQLSFL